MKRRFVRDEIETPAQRATRLIENYARRGWGIEDIQIALKRQHDINVGRNAIRLVVWAVQEKRI